MRLKTAVSSGEVIFITSFPEQNSGDCVVCVRLVRGAIRIGSKTWDKNSIFSNNVPELTRIFAKTTQLSTLKVHSNKMSRSQVTTTHVNRSEITVKKPSVFQMTTKEFGFPEVTVPKLSRSQLAPMQIKSAQIDIVKLSASDVNILQFNPAQISVLQNDVSKISITSSIAPKQFFYSYSFFFHNSTPPSIDTFDNSTFFNALYPDHITHATAWRNPDTWRVTIPELTGILNKLNREGDDNFNFNFMSNLP